MKSQKKLIFLLIIVICTFLFGEIGVRVLSNIDDNGNVWFKGRLLSNYQLPLSSLQSNVNRLDREKGFLKYDESLGWDNSSDFSSDGNIYCHNKEGIRSVNSSDIIEKKKQDLVLRIGLFGDSYAYGSEVIFEESIGARLTEVLKETNLKVEVINFGVGGYGLDQAYLKAKQEQNDYQLDVIVFCYQFENILRNFNVFRSLYSRQESLPFSKPKMLTNGSWINSKCLSPKDLLGEMNNESTGLLLHDSFYSTSRSFYKKSRLLSLILSFIEENRWNIYNNEKLAFKAKYDANHTFQLDNLISELGQTSQLIKVHLPRREDLINCDSIHQLSYFNHFERVDKTEWVETFYSFKSEIKHSDLDSYFSPGYHYSGKGYDLIARKVAEKIRLKNQ